MVKIGFVGDYSPRHRIGSLIEEKKYDYIFSEVKRINEALDYSVVNFESTIPDSDSKINKIGPSLKCTKDSLKALKWSGFNLLTLANNHFYDYGDQGVKNTLNEIYAAGLDKVGAGMNIMEASETFYKTIGDNSFAFINCCENEFSIATDNSGGCNPINPILQYYSIIEAKKKAEYVIVIVHGGHEMFQYPSIRMKQLYRFYVDVGADVVINHHQHCISGYEYYKNKPIIYGLGNFCFDWETPKPEIWYFGIHLIVNFGVDITISLKPFIQCKDKLMVKYIENPQKIIAEIDSINTVISSESLLKKEIDIFYSRSQKFYLSAFEPYSGKILSYAFSHKLLPSLFSHKRKLLAKNIIACESHRDMLIYSLVKSIEKNNKF